MQAGKVSSVMDFLEKPEKLSDTDKAEKVIRSQHGLLTYWQSGG